MDAKSLGEQRVYPGTRGDTGELIGLTKRELFAMAALQGLTALPTHKFETRSVGTRAVLAADELLAALVQEAPVYEMQGLEE